MNDNKVLAVGLCFGIFLEDIIFWKESVVHSFLSAVQGKISVMKNKIINLSLVLAIIAILVFFACYIRVRVTPDSVVVLRTSGMTCGSCEAKIRKILELQNGVASDEVNVDAGKVTVWYDSHAVQPEILAVKLTEIGFGSSLFIIMPVEKFMTITGKTGGTRTSAKSSWCSGCCVK